MPEISRFYGIVIAMFFDEQHQDELLVNWELARKDEQPMKIEPLQ